MTKQLSQIFASLGDSTRLDIVQRLFNKVMTISEIAKPYPISMAGVSKHIKVLEQADIIKRKRTGKYFYISLSNHWFQTITYWYEFYRKYWNQAFDQMDDYITKLQDEKDNE